MAVDQLGQSVPYRFRAVDRHQNLTPVQRLRQVPRLPVDQFQHHEFDVLIRAVRVGHLAEVEPDRRIAGLHHDRLGPMESVAVSDVRGRLIQVFCELCGLLMRNANML